ncbi:hypothetical protein D3880_06950 [Pseudomonas cavernae]|uniref:Chemotaxis protein n=1 Tax=Pseudomonas cavernae TaxID=2320867 RepID=A0A385Z1X9_9PSED|nr:hypothetical protein [Pseudomonas cavernae]AYC32137.1 hypothetical protein D3880_06950 [Pseudomonas cavernae]
MEELIAIGAALIAGLAALYARWSAHEAKKANDIGRLNALLALRQHYLELMNHQVKLAEFLKSSPSGTQAARETYAELDTKLRDVSREIEKYHGNLVSERT